MRLLKTTPYLTFLFSLLAISPAAGNKLRVVTTTTDLMSIAQAVGGEYVSVNSISSGKQDPHFIEAKPSYVLQLRKADLFIRIGLQLERGWERLVLESSRNARIQVGSEGHLDASAGIERLEVPITPGDRSLGDVHPEGNPHYWLDPYNARIVANTIARRLAALNPEDEAEYNRRAEQFIRRIDEAMFGEALMVHEDPEHLWRLGLEGKLDQYLESGRAVDGNPIPASHEGWYVTMRPFKGTKVVTYHRSWSFFLRRFGLVSVGELEAKPGIAPSPGHLKELIESMKQHEVPLIIVASFKGDKTPNLVASKTGARVVKVPYSVGGNDQAADYIALMDHLVSRISHALTQSK